MQQNPGAPKVTLSLTNGRYNIGCLTKHEKKNMPKSYALLVLSVSSVFSPGTHLLITFFSSSPIWWQICHNICALIRTIFLIKEILFECKAFPNLWNRPKQEISCSMFDWLICLKAQGKHTFDDPKPINYQTAILCSDSS